jgi:hypothetical protein
LRDRGPKSGFVGLSSQSFCLVSVKVFDFVEVIFKMAEVFGAPSLKKILEVAHFGGLVDMQSYLIGSGVGASGLLGQYCD